VATGKCKQLSGVSMLVRKTVLAAALAISSPPTLANYLTGKDLYADCSKPQGSFSQGFCSGYISGVVDAVEHYQVSKAAEKSVCVPKEVSIGQVKEIVVRYLTQHPDQRTTTASSLVWDALRNALPCKN
jgi:Ssp1 endopeptidase immunity protein Rap1a